MLLQEGARINDCAHGIAKSPSPRRWLIGQARAAQRADPPQDRRLARPMPRAGRVRRMQRFPAKGKRTGFFWGRTRPDFRQGAPPLQWEGPGDNAVELGVFAAFLEFFLGRLLAAHPRIAVPAARRRLVDTRLRSPLQVWTIVFGPPHFPDHVEEDGERDGRVRRGEEVVGEPRQQQEGVAVSGLDFAPAGLPESAGLGRIGQQPGGQEAGQDRV